MYSVSGLLESVLQKVRAEVIFGVRIFRLPELNRRGITLGGQNSNENQQFSRKKIGINKLCYAKTKQCEENVKNHKYSDIFN